MSITEKDCNNCRHHVQASIGETCGDCLARARVGNSFPLWQAEVEHEIDVPEGSFKTNPCREIAEKIESALAVQVGGNHYKDLKIQPVEFCIANKMDFFQKDIIKYISRRKGDKLKRIEDLKKARHYIDMYIEAIEQGNWE